MYENTTYEVILQRMLDRVPDKFDKREGSVIWDTHSPTAIEFQILYIELDTILREAYGDTASREFLILRCQERGISPHPASKAVLKGVFSPESINVSGKRFNIGEINYTVLAQIAPGQYQVQCEMSGSIGNQYLGAMVPIEYIKGLQTAELTEVLIPGEDEEGTEELRERYLNSFDEYAFGGNVRDYLEKVNTIPGVGATKVTRVWNGGISPSSMIPAKSVEDWYETVRGSLEGEVKAWLDCVFCAAKEKKLTTGGTVLLTVLDSGFHVASDALIQKVQEIMDPDENAGEGLGLAPVGHVVSVKSASAVPVFVETSITFADGYGWDNLQSLLENAVSEYLLELRKEWAGSSNLTVRMSQIDTRFLGTPGVVDVQGTMINGIKSNLVLGEFDVPVFGGISHD